MEPDNDKDQRSTDHALIFCDLPFGRDAIFQQDDPPAEKLRKTEQRLNEFRLIKSTLGHQGFQFAEERLLREVTRIDRREIWSALILKDEGEIRRLTIRRTGIIGVLAVFHDVDKQIEKIERVLSQLASGSTPESESEEPIDG